DLAGQIAEAARDLLDDLPWQGEHDDVCVACRIRRCGCARPSSGGGDEPCHVLAIRIARAVYDLVAELSEALPERAADIAGADDRDRLGVRACREQRRSDGQQECPP